MTKKQTVKKSNRLVEARYRLSLNEQRLTLLALCQIDHASEVTDQTIYVVTASDLAKLTGMARGGAYSELRRAADQLYERRLSLVMDTPTGPKRRRTRWVQTADYMDAEGAVGIRFGHDVIPFLTELRREFTCYPLEDIGKIATANGVRLYELLIQWRSTGRREIEIEELRLILGLEQKYQNIRDLKRRVVDPAVAQLNENSPLWCRYTQRKAGRRVVALVFEFGEKPQAKATPAKAKRAKPKALPQAFIEQHIRAGETQEQAEERLLFEIRTGKRQSPSKAQDK